LRLIDVRLNSSFLRATAVPIVTIDQDDSTNSWIDALIHHIA
jgi:hypothetical protein